MLCAMSKLYRYHSTRGISPAPPLVEMSISGTELDRATRCKAIKLGTSVQGEKGMFGNRQHHQNEIHDGAGVPWHHTCFPSLQLHEHRVLGAMLGENELMFSSPELMTCVPQYALPTQPPESKNKMNEWILQWEAQNEEKQCDYLLGQEGKAVPHLLLPLLPPSFSSSLFLPVYW